MTEIPVVVGPHFVEVGHDLRRLVVQTLPKRRRDVADDDASQQNRAQNDGRSLSVRCPRGLRRGAAARPGRPRLASLLARDGRSGLGLGFVWSRASKASRAARNAAGETLPPPVTGRLPAARSGPAAWPRPAHNTHSWSPHPRSSGRARGAGRSSCVRLPDERRSTPGTLEEAPPPVKEALGAGSVGPRGLHVAGDP